MATPTPHVKHPTQFQLQEMGNESFNDAYKIWTYAMYLYQGTPDAFAAAPMPLLDKPYDYGLLSNPDVNGNYQTIQFKIGGAGGTLQRTLALTFDASSNITSFTRS